FALVTLMREYVRIQGAGVHGVERDRVVEALLNGLSADARAFVGDHPPSSLLTSEADRVEFRDLFRTHRSELLDEFERFRPKDEGVTAGDVHARSSRTVGPIVRRVLPDVRARRRGSSVAYSRLRRRTRELQRRSDQAWSPRSLGRSALQIRHGANPCAHRRDE